MPILILIGLEIYGFWQVVALQGFFLTFFMYWLPTVLGFYFLKRYSTHDFAKLQIEMSKGSMPAKASLNLALKFIGSLFLCVPFVSTRLIAFPLLFPPTRYLLILVGEFWLIKRIFKSPMMGFAFQNRGFAFRAGSRFGGAQPTAQTAENEIRDVSEAIDVDFVALESGKVTTDDKLKK